MKNSLREFVYCELGYLIEFMFEPMAAISGTKLNTILAKVQPAATIIHHVSSGEHFMRVGYEECCASASLECLLEFGLGLEEISVPVQVRGRHIR